MKKGTIPAFTIRTKKAQARFKKIKNPLGPDIGVCEFFLQIDITAAIEPVYIPLSIASGKKPTGFVYQIEGTAQGDISQAEVTTEGGATQLTLGTIRYAKIPAQKSATFRILIEMKGRMQNTYTVSINRINYKLDPTTARYEKLPTDIRSKTLKLQ